MEKIETKTYEKLWKMRKKWKHINIKIVKNNMKVFGQNAQHIRFTTKEE